MKVELERTEVEVFKKRPHRHGRYERVSGAWVVVDGVRQEPPLPIREANKLAARIRFENEQN